MRRNPNGYMARHDGRYPRRTIARIPSYCERCQTLIGAGARITYSPKLACWIHARCAITKHKQ